MYEVILEKLIADGHITQEKFDELVAEKQKELAENPPPFVEEQQARATRIEAQNELNNENFMALVEALTETGIL